MGKLCSRWTDYHEIWYLSIFWKNLLSISSFVKIWQELGILHMQTDIHFWSYLLHFFPEWEMFQTKVVEKIKTHILCSITFSFFRKSRVYEIIWKNIVERSRPQMTIWLMRIACWITEATNTHSECVILIAFLLQQWLRERASTLRYTYIGLSCRT